MSFERTRLPLRGRIAVVLCAATLGCASAPLLAQTASSTPGDLGLRFEVVSIRPHAADDQRVSIRMSEDGYTATGVGLGSLIKGAYGGEDWWEMDVPGMPASLKEAHYDIQAKMDPETIARLKAMNMEDRRTQSNLMMRALLEERCHLQVHIITKDAQMYSLVVAKGGLKMKESAPAPPPDPDAPKGQEHPRGMMRVGMGEMTGESVKLDQLAGNLGGQVHSKVINNTGLKGQYNFTLKWNWHEQFGKGDSGSETDSLPSLYTALEEQLGLELKSIRGAVKAVVVDHIEAPSEN